MTTDPSSASTTAGDLRATLDAVTARAGFGLCVVTPEGAVEGDARARQLLVDGLDDELRAVAATPGAGRQRARVLQDRSGRPRLVARVWPTDAGTFVVLEPYVADTPESVRLGSHDDHLQQVVETTRIARGAATMDGRILEVNDVFCQLFGYEETELLGMNIGELTHPEDRPRTVGYIRALIDGEASEWSTVKRYVRADGEIFTGQLSVTVLHDREGRPDRMVALLNDVTDRTAAVEALREAEELFRRIFDDAPVGMALVRPDGVIVLVNETLATMIGSTVEGSEGSSIFDWLHPDDRDEDVATTMALMEGRIDSYVRQNRYVRTDGRVVWAEVNASLLRHADGSPRYVVAQLRDITDQRRAREALAAARDELEASNTELQRSNRALADFAGIVAHDLRSPLTVVRTYLELLNHVAADQLPPETARYVSEAVRGTITMNEIIEGLLTYAEVGGQTRTEDVDPNLVLQEVLIGHRMQPGEEASFTVGSLPRVHADRVRLRRLFDNLVGNAVKYQDASRSLEVHVTGRRDGDRVEIRVIDNGIGIPAEDRGRVLEVFARARGREVRGHGLGLAICARIVRNAGGDIRVEDGIDGGTAVVLTLPPARSDA